MKNWLKSLKNRARDGCPEAQLELAQRFSMGEGVVKSQRKALFWYRKAALAENPDALYNLGLIYIFGEGVERDFGCAVACLDKAVLCGSADACLALAEAYEFGGIGLSVDCLKSADLYIRAARLGSFKAIRSLGHLLGDGRVSSAELSALMKNFEV